MYVRLVLDMAIVDIVMLWLTSVAYVGKSRLDDAESLLFLLLCELSCLSYSLSRISELI